MSVASQSLHLKVCDPQVPEGNACKLCCHESEIEVEYQYDLLELIRSNESILVFVKIFERLSQALPLQSFH